MTPLVTRPPSPRTLAHRYRQGTREESVLMADAVTAGLDLAALKEEAGRVIGKKAVDAFRIAEGGFNQAIAVIFEDGSDIIARLNCSSANQDENVGETELERRVSSEFTTLKILREKTTIPVPRVYSVNAQTSNPIGARYMLQERIIGGGIYPVLNSLSDSQRERLATQLIDYETELLTMELPAIGSPSESTDGSSFRIDKLVDPMIPYYASIQHRGPWDTPVQFLEALAIIEYEFIVNNTDAWKARRRRYYLHNKDGDEAPFEFIRSFFQLLHEAIRGLQLDSEVPFILYNHDLTDILVSWEDPAQIVGLIDWEGTSSLPMWAAISDQYIDLLFRDEDRAEQWRTRRRDILESKVPKFKEAVESGLMARSLFRFFKHSPSTGYSPAALAEYFMSCYNEWPGGSKGIFEPLVDFLRESGFAS